MSIYETMRSSSGSGLVLGRREFLPGSVCYIRTSTSIAGILTKRNLCSDLRRCIAEGHWRWTPETRKKTTSRGGSPREDQTILPELTTFVKPDCVFLARVAGSAYAVAMRTTCSKTGCAVPAVAICGFSYADRQVWIDVRPDEPDLSTYGLCDAHARALRAPRGWSLIDLRAEAREPIRRLASSHTPVAADLLSLASVVDPRV